MDYVNFVSLADLSLQPNRAFVFPLSTPCGLFKLTVKRKGHSLLAAVELSPPTYNGSEQFSWFLPNVALKLRLLDAPGHEYSGTWTFSTNSRTWITEYISCAEIYELSRCAPAPLPPSPNWALNPARRRAKPPTAPTSDAPPVFLPALEIQLTLPMPSVQVFSLSDNAAIHTCAHYRAAHRAIHLILLSGVLMQDVKPPDPLLKEFLLDVADLESRTAFHRLLSYLSRTYPRLLQDDLPSIFMGLTARIVSDHRALVRLADWEGDCSSLKSILSSCRSLGRSPKVILLRLNADSGYLKTLMKRASINVPISVELDSTSAFSCVGATLSLGRTEISLFRNADRWLRVSDHSYDRYKVADHIVCHKRLLPTTLMFVESQYVSKERTVLGEKAQRVLSTKKPLISGATAAGGVALTSHWSANCLGPVFDLTSQIRAQCPQMYFGVIPWHLQTPEDNEALRDILKLGDCTSCLDEQKCVMHTGGGECSSTSASSEVPRHERATSWFRLASLYWKHIGYLGVLWADTLVHNPLPVRWPADIIESVFRRKRPGSSTTRSLARRKRVGVILPSISEQHRLTPSGKRRRLPLSDDGSVGSTHPATPSDTKEGQPIPRYATGSTAPSGARPSLVTTQHTSGRWCAIRHLLNNLLHSRYNTVHQLKKTAAAAAKPSQPADLGTYCALEWSYIRLSFEFDPLYSYLVSVPTRMSALDFQASLLTNLGDCAERFSGDPADWLPWTHHKNGRLSLWKRHGTTWRQILSKSNLLSQEKAGGGSVDPQEIMALLHTPDEPPLAITETLLDLYCLDQYTFEPLHVGATTSLSGSTVEDLYATKIRPRIGASASTPKAGLLSYGCATADGQPVIENWPIKKLRMSQGALYFSPILPVASRPLSRKKLKPKCLAAEARRLPTPPAPEPTRRISESREPSVPPNFVKLPPGRPLLAAAKCRRQARGLACSQDEISRRQLDTLWANFISGRLQSATDLAVLANLMRRNKTRALKCIDQIKVVDSRVCELIQQCGEALVPTMANTKSATKRLSAVQKGEGCSIAASLMAKLQACLLSAAGRLDRSLCDSCIHVLGIVDQDELTNGIFNITKH